jgi:hypothetical protein
LLSSAVFGIAVVVVVVVVDVGTVAEKKQKRTWLTQREDSRQYAHEYTCRMLRGSRKKHWCVLNAPQRAVSHWMQCFLMN